jgi:LPXTG-motif cell wall-anchored protein
MSASSSAASQSSAASGSVIGSAPAGTNWTMIVIVVGVILTGGLLWFVLRKKK